MTWTTLADSLFAVGKPVTASLLRALRDNIASVVSPDDNAPTNRATWHPHNRTINGDANTGLIYDFATDGALSTITSPDFVDKFEYQLVFRSVTMSAVGAALQLALYQDTTNAYTVAATLWSGTGQRSGLVTLPFARAGFANQPVHIHTDTDGNLSLGFSLAAAEKVRRMRLTVSGGTVNGGKIFLFRRMTHYGI